MINSKITNILENLREWWNTSAKTDDDIYCLISGKIIICNHKFVITSGHRAFLNAINETTDISIIDCGTPYTESELISNLKTKLNSLITMTMM